MYCISVRHYRPLPLLPLSLVISIINTITFFLNQQHVEPVFRFTPVTFSFFLRGTRRTVSEMSATDWKLLTHNCCSSFSYYFCCRLSLPLLDFFFNWLEGFISLILSVLHPPSQKSPTFFFLVIVFIDSSLFTFFVLFLTKFYCRHLLRCSVQNVPTMLYL